MANSHARMHSLPVVWLSKFILFISGGPVQSSECSLLNIVDVWPKFELIPV